jgi:hypothetical protein
LFPSFMTKILGVDKITAFMNVLKKFVKTKGTVTNRYYAFFGEHLLKHCTNGVDRGRIVQTFKKMGVDLSKFINDTTRLPQLKAPINPNDVSRGLREFILPNGTKLRLTGEIGDSARFYSDIVNDKRSPLKQFFDEELKKVKK